MSSHKPKRTLVQSLAEQVLDEKLEFLRSKGLKGPIRNLQQPEVLDHTAFPYLLEVCLAVERANSQEAHTAPPLDPETKTAEDSGDYDYSRLQNEDISQATRHATYLGPVKVSTLPDPKKQGVVAARDIRKGELLCTSVPAIVVQNLASIDDPADLLFSDVSRAEMAAKLTCMAERSPSIRTTLRSFEFAEKECIAQDDLPGLCGAIISKYTWAIDHPSTNPQGRKFRGKHTKVSGHAFTVSGYAGKFNHSCVPNATMVSYGAVQFFRANVAIDRNTEICVSYGFDPLDCVHTRRRKLRDHAGFDCVCPLCLYQLDHPVEFSSDSFEGETFNDFLHHILRGARSWPDQISSINTDPLSDLAMGGVVTTAELLLDPTDPYFPKSYLDFDILQVLTIQHRVQAELNGLGEVANPYEELVQQCVLLSTMLLALALPRTQDIGIQFGDYIRTNMQLVAKHLEKVDLPEWVRHDSYDSKWWMDQSMQYTDTF